MKKKMFSHFTFLIFFNLHYISHFCNSTIHHMFHFFQEKCIGFTTGIVFSHQDLSTTWVYPPMSIIWMMFSFGAKTKKPISSTRTYIGGTQRKSLIIAFSPLHFCPHFFALLPSEVPIWKTKMPLSRNFVKSDIYNFFSNYLGMTNIVKRWIQDTLKILRSGRMFQEILMPYLRLRLMVGLISSRMSTSKPLTIVQ